MNKKVYDPDGDGKFDSDEIELTGAKGLASLAAFSDHDAAEHTNKRRRIFIPVSHVVGATDEIHGYLLDAAGEQLAGFTVVPDGILNPNTAIMYLVWRAKIVAGVAVVTSHYYSAAHDEPYNTNTDTDANRTLASVSAINDIGIEDLGLDFTGITKGEELEIYMLGAAGITEDLNVQGWIFDYECEE